MTKIIIKIRFMGNVVPILGSRNSKIRKKKSDTDAAEFEWYEKKKKK